MAALRDVARLNGFASLADEIHEDYLVHRRQQGIKRFKVVPRLEDRADYESILEGDPVGTTVSTGLFGAYSFFKREWKKLVGEQNDATIRRILVAATAQMSLVTVTVGGENPYEIFESLNSTGLALEESDLIRNFLFMQVPPEDQERFQSTYWEPFESRFDAVDGYAKLPPTLFYRSYLMREGDYCRNKAAYVEFKAQNIDRGLKPPAQVEELQKFAGFELWLRRPLTCQNPDLRDSFAEIQALDITTAHPLLLNLLDKHKRGVLDLPNICGRFTDLASFVIRRSVCRESTRGYGRLFPAAVKAISFDPDEELRKFLLNEGWPDDAAFVPALVEFPIYKRERNKCRLLLEALERHFRHKEELNLNQLSVEHVLPQTIDGDRDEAVSWQKVLGATWRTTHEKWVHTLGNLTLTGYNAELGDGSFTEKNAAFAESKVSLNRHFCSLDQWTEYEIRQRGQELAKIVAQIWPRPTEGPSYVAPASSAAEPEDASAEVPLEEDGRVLRGRSKLLIRIFWSRLGKALPDEEISERTATTTMAAFVGRLIRVFGESMTERLCRVQVSRRYPLSANPTVDFLNPAQGRPFAHTSVPGTDLCVFTNTSNKEKRDDLRGLVKLLDFPPGSVEILLVG